jgi:hypothetical protein
MSTLSYAIWAKSAFSSTACRIFAASRDLTRKERTFVKWLAQRLAPTHEWVWASAFSAYFFSWRFISSIGQIICGAGSLLADSSWTLSGMHFKRNLALRLSNPESIGSPFEYVLHAGKIFCVDLWVATHQLEHQRERAGTVAAEQVLISF